MWTDGQTDMTKLTVTFRIFSNVQVNAEVYLHDITEYIFGGHMALTPHLRSLNDYTGQQKFWPMRKSVCF